MDESNSRIQILNALQTANPDPKLRSITPEELRSLESELVKTRSEQNAKIAETLAKLKDPSADPSVKKALENHLRDLFLKMNLIDEKVSEIKNRLALTDKINSKDEEIQRLNERINSLEKSIADLKAAAKQISESADKISK